MAENIYRKTGPDTFEPVDLQDRTAKRLKMDQSQLGLRFDEIPIGAHFGVAPSIVRVHATAAVENADRTRRRNLPHRNRQRKCTAASALSFTPTSRAGEHYNRAEISNPLLRETLQD